jgi:hypothetical protein
VVTPPTSLWDTLAQRRPLLPRGAPSLGLIALKVAVSAWVVHLGFTHVSDDDYARVVIAETFAHTPSFDPSGTSWLPFPFWLTGAAMAGFGRTISVAQGVALIASVVGTLAVHRALLGAGTKPWVAWLGVALATSAPWSAWLGVATVPEALTASLVAVGALTLAQPRHRVWGALALGVGALSRYEAWPVALVFAAVCVVAAARRSGGSPRSTAVQLGAAAIAACGPVAWLVWNWRVHGDPFSFVARVAAYRAHFEPGAVGTWTLFPRALVRAGGGALVLMLLGAPGAWLDRELRARWAAPLGAMVAMAAFLVEGGLHDGAPTHHPERALIALFWLATAFGIDGIRSVALRAGWGRTKREAVLFGAVVAAAVACTSTWLSEVAAYPGRGSSEDRSAQIAEGEALRARHVPHLSVTPCAYEHFALVAAFGAPERVTVEAPAATAPEHCPQVVER